MGVRTRRQPKLPGRVRAGTVIAGVAAGVAACLVTLAVSGTVDTPQAAGSAETRAQSIPALPEPERQWSDVVFLGDSYTEGAGSSTATRDRRWSTMLARAMEWDEHNLSIPGTGYAAGAEEYRSFEFLVEEARGVSPDIVVVSGGRNDSWFAADVVGSAATRLFARLASQLPDTTVIVLAPWWDDEEPPVGFQGAADAIRAAAHDAGIRYVDSGQPLLSRPDRVARDGVHPNDDGHAELARAVEVALRSD